MASGQLINSRHINKMKTYYSNRLMKIITLDIGNYIWEGEINPFTPSPIPFSCQPGQWQTELNKHEYMRISDKLNKYSAHIFERRMFVTCSKGASTPVPRPLSDCEMTEHLFIPLCRFYDQQTIIKTHQCNASHRMQARLTQPIRASQDNGSFMTSWQTRLFVRYLLFRLYTWYGLTNSDKEKRARVNW